MLGGMEQQSFLERMKLHVTADFLRGILFIYAVSMVSPIIYGMLSSGRVCGFYGCTDGWMMFAFYGVFCLVFLTLAMMLLLRMRYCAVSVLGILSVFFVVNVVGFFLVALPQLLNPSGEFLPSVSSSVFGAVQRWSHDIFLIVCAVWLYKWSKDSPLTKRQPFLEQIKIGANSDFLRGILFAYATSWVWHFVFSLLTCGHRSWSYRISDTWLWNAFLLIIALAYCAIAVVLFMQTRRCAKFTLAALVVLLAIDAQELFVYSQPILQRLSALSAESFAAYIRFEAWRWFVKIFFIALAAWFYKKSKVSTAG